MECGEAEEGRELSTVVDSGLEDQRGPDDEMVVALDQGLGQRDWQQALGLQGSDETCEARVVSVNQGGVVVRFGRLRGFVPNSQLASVPEDAHGERLHRFKTRLIGQPLTLAVIDVDQEEQRLILSERAAERQRREDLLEEIEEGQIRTGTVCSLAPFGAFVDLGGVDGLIHVSELDRGHVAHPSDVVSIGDEVKVRVLSVDRERERIGLSRKRLLPDPWDRVTERLRPGQVIEGTVTGVAKFGAFVEIGEGVEGLVHVSEMPGGDALLETLERGSSVTVRLLRIDHERRRIALSLRLTMYQTPLSANPP
jgi:small subunit ribosomal protein S1